MRWLKYAIFIFILAVLVSSVCFLWNTSIEQSNEDKVIINISEIPTGTLKATAKDVKTKSETQAKKPPAPKSELKVTFVELGSVKCIPCKMMQPIMDEIAREYKGQVEVVFYDVWTPEGRPYAEKYRIRSIPTQVFLDKNGEEYYRHLGFFPKEEIIKVLRLKGIE